MKSIYITFFLLASCNSQKGVKTFKQANDAVFVPVPLISKKIDASKLILYDLSAVNSDIGGITSGSIRFEASDFTQWIEVKSCPSNGSCSTGTSVTQRIALPPFEPGPVEVSLRGCVESQYAIDSNINCGEWTNIRYNQPDTSSPFKSQLLREEAARISSIETTVGQLKGLTEGFAREMETCEKNARKVSETSARGSLIVGLLALGEVIAGKAVSMYFKKNPINGLDPLKGDPKAAANPTSGATSKDGTGSAASDTTAASKAATSNPAETKRTSATASTSTTSTTSTAPATTKGTTADKGTPDASPASAADVPKKPSFIESSLKNLLGKVNVKGAFAGISTASDKLGGLASPIAFIKQGASALGLFQGGNPISAFGAIGGAIFSAFNANNLVLETCTARERYEASSESLILKLNSERFLLQGVYKQLEQELP